MESVLSPSSLRRLPDGVRSGGFHPDIVSRHELRDDDPRTPRLYSLIRREVRGRALRMASSWAVRFHERERLATIRGGLRTWLTASGLDGDGGQFGWTITWGSGDNIP